MQLRKISSSQKQLAQRLHEIEVRLEDHDERVEAIFEAILSPPVRTGPTSGDLEMYPA